MSLIRTDGKPLAAGALRWRRWLVVGLLSLLLHGLALNWVGGNFNLPGPTSEPAQVMRTVLLQAEKPEAAPVATPPAPRPEPVKRPKHKAPQPKPAAIADTSAPAAESPVVATADQAAVTLSPDPALSADAQAAIAASQGLAEPGIADNTATVASQSTPTPVPGGNRYKVNPPPSAALKYDVLALRAGQEVYGHGTIAWQFNGSHYIINGDAGILFFSVFDFSSRGQIDEFGIAPVQYTEKRWRRPQTDTLFNRDRNLISFSASAKSFPLQGGEQDRASIVWQLAGIGRGDAARFVPDAQIPVFIAGVRDGSIWNIQVIGEEEIEVGLGKLRTWHVQRTPRAGDHDQILDIWLAPAHDWYPVRLRYTETNGDYLDMSLSGIEATTRR